MGFKNFFISIIKTLIILVLATLIFSTVTLNVPNLIKDLFRDTFQYSSPEMQKEIVGKLTLACSGLEGKDFEGFGNLNIPVPLDFNKIGALCKDYNGGKIDDQKFFFSVIEGAFNGSIKMPKANVIEKYNAVINFLNTNKIIYFVILAVLLILLYLLIMEIKSFLITLTGISFSIGVFILLPYAAIIAYDKFVGIDTTPILVSILGGNISFDAKAIISVVLLMILRTYTSFIITLGILFFGIGVAGKVYSWRLKKQSKKTETKEEKKSEKEELKKAKAAKEEKIKPKNKEKDEDIDEAYKHRNRTTKEILDELEEMHKKKRRIARTSLPNN